MELITHKPNNSPEIVVLQDPAAFTASFGWFVKTGACDESKDIAGVSHFLEHMVFKGTQRRTAEDVNRELDQLGAQSNAFTSEDSTVFYASVLPECQEQAVDLLSDLMQPHLREDDFEMERKVILEEIAMYDDQPPYGAFEKANELFFGDHPLATRVLGTADSVADITQKQMEDYHRARYTKDNMFLIASGKIDVAQLVDYVSEVSSDWPDKAVSMPQQTPVFGAGKATIEREQTHQFYSVHLWPGVSSNDPDRYALRMLCSILADDSGSRMFWELIDTGKAESAALWPQMFDDCGCIAGYMCCDPEDVEENEAIFNRVLKASLEQPVTERELELAKNKISSSLILSDERPSNRLFALGQTWLSRRNYEPLDVVLSRYEAVTADDVLRVARNTLEHQPVSVNVTGPQE